MCSGKELGASEDGAGLLILEDRPALGTPINEILTDSDTVFTLEVTPNRPDCLSHIGIARELAAWYRRKLTYPSIDGLAEDATTQLDDSIFSGVSVECEEDCPHYMATVIKALRSARVLRGCRNYWRQLDSVRLTI